MRLTSLLIFSTIFYSTISEAKPTHRCATPLYWQQAVQQPPANLPRKAVDVKEYRPQFGQFANLATSANFAFQAGGAAPDAENVQQILAALERSFTHEIDLMGHPLPVGADQFLINVFLGNSPGAPTIDDFAYAYVTLSGGIPYIVVHPDLLREYNTNQFGFADTTLAHEFYHAIQFGTHAYNEDNGYWFWEATADWISVEVFPEYVDGDFFVPGYLMYPQMALEAVDFQGDLTGIHHYGAQIFARFLSEKIADASFIRDVWTTGLSADRPLDVIDRLLAERGENLDDVFLSFAAHNAVLDYERADSYEEALSFYVPFYPNEDFRVVGSIFVANEEGSMLIEDQAFPEMFAYNVLDISGVPQESFTIDFRGEAQGNVRSDASFRLLVIKKVGAEVSYIPLEVKDNQTNVTFEDFGDYDELLLVISSQPRDAASGEIFRYKVRAFGTLEFFGGSCSVTPTNNNALALFLSALVLLVITRRSRTPRA